MGAWYMWSGTDVGDQLGLPNFESVKNDHGGTGLLGKYAPRCLAYSFLVCQTTLAFMPSFQTKIMNPYSQVPIMGNLHHRA